MKEWRKNNKDKISSSFRAWYGNNRDRPYYLERSKTPVKDGEEYGGTSGLGRRYEKIANAMLLGSKLSKTFHEPFDLEWNGMKIDVKMRNKNKNGGYIFTKKPRCIADFFLCFCVDGNIKAVFLFPREIYKSAINITDKKMGTVYKKYLFIAKEE